MSLAERLRQEGEQRGRLATVRFSVLNMLREGLTPTQIIKYIGFDEGEVFEIIKNKDTDIKFNNCTLCSLRILAPHA